MHSSVGQPQGSRLVSFSSTVAEFLDSGRCREQEEGGGRGGTRAGGIKECKKPRGKVSVISRGSVARSEEHTSDSSHTLASRMPSSA